MSLRVKVNLQSIFMIFTFIYIFSFGFGNEFLLNKITILECKDHIISAGLYPLMPKSEWVMTTKPTQGFFFSWLYGALNCYSGQSMNPA